MSAVERKKKGQSKVGVVVKKSSAKTVRVDVERVVIHPVYKRYVRSRKGFLAHDPNDSCVVGDVVEIHESRPLSARKRWRVKRVVASRYVQPSAAQLEAETSAE